MSPTNFFVLKLTWDTGAKLELDKDKSLTISGVDGVLGESCTGISVGDSWLEFSSLSLRCLLEGEITAKLE